ncbi:hypothetical protein EON62_05820, partial [archaeon]
MQGGGAGGEGERGEASSLGVQSIVPPAVPTPAAAAAAASLLTIAAYPLIWDVEVPLVQGRGALRPWSFPFTVSSDYPLNRGAVIRTVSDTIPGCARGNIITRIEDKSLASGQVIALLDATLDAVCHRKKSLDEGASAGPPPVVKCQIMAPQAVERCSLRFKSVRVSELMTLIAKGELVGVATSAAVPAPFAAEGVRERGAIRVPKGLRAVPDVTTATATLPRTGMLAPGDVLLWSCGVLLADVGPRVPGGSPLDRLQSLIDTLTLPLALPASLSIEVDVLV